MKNSLFENLCKKIVIDYFNKNAEITDNKKITEEDVFIVWICKYRQ